VQRALEIGCEEVLMAKNGVDGVYDSDPRTNPGATKLEHVTYGDALQQGLKVVDSTAFSLCMDNAQQMMVFGLDTPGNITRAMRGDRIGTVVTK
jgi:uridylate kinase